MLCGFVEVDLMNFEKHTQPNSTCKPQTFKVVKKLRNNIQLLK